MKYIRQDEVRLSERHTKNLHDVQGLNKNCLFQLHSICPWANGNTCGNLKPEVKGKRRGLEMKLITFAGTEWSTFTSELWRTLGKALPCSELEMVVDDDTHDASSVVEGALTRLHEPYLSTARLPRHQRSAAVHKELRNRFLKISYSPRRN